MAMKRVCISGALLSLLVAASGGAQAPHSASTWGLVSAVAGPNIMLDDGQLVRLAPTTRITRADGQAATRADVWRHRKVVVTFAADGTVAEVRVFAPRSAQEHYLSNLAPVRGSANVMAVSVGGEPRSRSMALLRVTYNRPANWTQFRSQIRYDPAGAGAAPAAARFMLKDSFGDLIVDRVIAAGQTDQLNVGLDAQATDRLTLEAAPAGEGQLQQDWCLWLDPHFVTPVSTTAAQLLRKDTPERLAEALTQALGEARIDGLAVAQFTPLGVSADQFYMQDLSQDLLVLLGRKFRVAGVYGKKLDVGTLLPDGNRTELQKLPAAYVLIGSVSARAEGTVLNACVVQVDNGALVASATVRE